MLLAHLNATENTLLAQSQIASNTGHPLHKGTPRESFIKEFLASHLPETVAVGTGEIIDYQSKAGVPRRQHDIVLYKKSFPKLDIGGGVNAFLAESVLATIEIKSHLDKKELAKAITAAQTTKQLNVIRGSGFFTGYIPPSILSFVVSYDSPQIDTVLKWVKDLDNELKIGDQNRLNGLERKARERVAANGLDGVFCLGKGWITYDNVPVSFLMPEFLKQIPDASWSAVSENRGALAYLFILLVTLCTAVNQSSPNLSKYLNNFSIKYENLHL